MSEVPHVGGGDLFHLVRALLGVLALVLQNLLAIEIRGGRQ